MYVDKPAYSENDYDSGSQGIGIRGRKVLSVLFL